MKRSTTPESVRWDLALRYRMIETVVWWEGRLTTQHLIQSFGISRQQASKDINTYITEHASKNLEYDKHLKGYVPSKRFQPRFIDDSASAYLHLLNQSHDWAPHIEGLALAYAHTEVLDVPDRSVRPEVLRPLLKACRERQRLECEYVSFTTPDGETRAVSRGEAIRLAADTPVIVLNAPLIGQRLGYGDLSGLDILELFAFLRPARFMVPTPKGLARACDTLMVVAPGGEATRGRRGELSNCAPVPEPSETPRSSDVVFS